MAARRESALGARPLMKLAIYATGGVQPASGPARAFYGDSIAIRIARTRHYRVIDVVFVHLSQIGNQAFRSSVERNARAGVPLQPAGDLELQQGELDRSSVAA